jgi:hypothetical protein
MIAESLRSIKAYVDRFVIVDAVFKSNASTTATHSTDATRQVCELICPPVSFTYFESQEKLTEQDARNKYLAEVDADDWILWLDGDEVLYGEHKDILEVVRKIRAGEIEDCVSIPTYTTAILYQGLGKDMPVKEFATNPLINTWDYQTKWFRKEPGQQYINELAFYEDACYDKDRQLVTDSTKGRSDVMLVINHHARQSHEKYVNDCIWALAQRSGRSK